MTIRPTPQQCLTTALVQVAPDVDPNDVDADLHDDLGLDSMDLLNLATAISVVAGIEIPERDLSRLRTIRGLEEYLGHRFDASAEALT